MLEKDKDKPSRVYNAGGRRRAQPYVLFGVSVLIYREDVISDRKKIRNVVRWLGTCNKINGGHGDHYLAEGDTKKEVMEQLNAYTKESFEKLLNQSEILTKWVEVEVPIREKGRLVLKECTRQLMKYDSVTGEIMGAVEGHAPDGANPNVTRKLYLDGEHCGNLNITPTAIVELFKEDK